MRRRTRLAYPFLGAVWTFFVEPQSARAVAIFRVTFGLLACWTGVGIAHNLERYWGPDGMVPWKAVADLPYAGWSLIALSPHSHAWLVTLAAAFCVAAVTFTLGIAPRLSSALLFVLHLSFQHRTPYILNSGDRLFGIVVALSTLLPLGRHAALGPRLRALLRLGEPASESKPAREPSGFAQRLVGCQLAYMYWFSCVAKLRNFEWLEGTAVQNVLASPIYAEWPTVIPYGLSLLLSWSTLLFELAFPLLVWHPRFRRRALLAGIAFHAGIEISMTIPMFSAVVVACYPLFLTDQDVTALAAWLKSVVARLRVAARSTPPYDTPTPTR